MMYSAFSGFLRLCKFSWRIGLFSLILAVLFSSLSLLTVMTPVVQTVHAQNHGCAPDTAAPIPDAQPAPATAGSVIINEALSQPDSAWNCSDSSKNLSASQDSWIELYNPQNYAIDLYAAHMQLSINNGGNSINFRFSFGSAIQANGFLVVFPFRTQSVAFFTGWEIILNINGMVIDQATILTLQPDQSYARVPDGSATWLSCGSPTIDASNNACNQPVTPTPTRTPTPTKTPVSTVTPASSATLTPAATLSPTASAGTGGATTATGSGGGSDQPGSSGTQPAWGQLRLPGDPTSTPDLSTTAGSSPLPLTQPRNSTMSQNNGVNTGLVILFVSLALALLAGLAWWWKFARKT